MDTPDSVGSMGVVDVERFVADGFVKLEASVPREVADAARELA